MDVEFNLDEIDNLLEQTKKEIGLYAGVKTGYMTDKQYKNGLKVAENALIQEFGADIEIPEQEREINFKIDKNGKSRFSKKKQANFQQTVKIKAHKVNIPARPFIRNCIDKNEESWKKLFNKNLGNEKLNLKQNLNLLGEQIKDDLRQSIDDTIDPPNANSTIKSKKSSHPLINTGRLKQSIQQRVIKYET